MNASKGATGLWKISVSVDDQAPVEMLLDNGINEIYVQALAWIETDHISEALQVIQPYAVVGLVALKDTLYVRSGFFIDHSTMHALTNSYRAVAYACVRYHQAIAG